MATSKQNKVKKVSNTLQARLRPIVLQAVQQTGSEFLGEEYSFDRRYGESMKRPDFLIATPNKMRIAVEADLSTQHNIRFDYNRDEVLLSMGISTIRLLESEISKPSYALEKIVSGIKEVQTTGKPLPISIFGRRKKQAINSRNKNLPDGTIFVSTSGNGHKWACQIAIWEPDLDFENGPGRYLYSKEITSGHRWFCSPELCNQLDAALLAICDFPPIWEMNPCNLQVYISTKQTDLHRKIVHGEACFHRKVTELFCKHNLRYVYNVTDAMLGTYFCDDADYSVDDPDRVRSGYEVFSKLRGESKILRDDLYSLPQEKIAEISKHTNNALLRLAIETWDDC